MAMVSFTMAFSTDKVMNIIYAACLDTVSKIEMRQQLSKIKMRKGGNPSILFESLTTIQNQYLGSGNRLPKDELIPIILDVATDEYRPVLTVIRKMRGQDLTVEDLEDSMNEEYRQINKGKSRRIEENQGELLLTAFQGLCYKCGKPGHRANQCQSKGLSRRFTGKCGSCGKVGHKSKDCWLKEENKGKRPEGWKKTMRKRP